MRLTKSSVKRYIELLIVFLVLHTDGFVKYLAFGMYILYYALINNLIIDRNKLVILYPSIFLCLWGVIIAFFNGNIEYTFKEVCFVLIPAVGAQVISSSLNKDKLNEYINIMFWVVATVFLAFGIRKYTPNDLMESTYAFSFGIYVLYFFYKKSYKRMTVAILLTFLSHKRIVWGAVIICVVAIMILTNNKSRNLGYYKKDKNTIRSISAIIILLLLLYVYLCSSGLIETIMIKLGLDSMGRLDTWKYCSKYYYYSPLYFGQGLGSVQKYLNEYASVYFTRLHNDILRFYIELGFCGFVLYIYAQFDAIVRLLRRKVLNFKKSIIITAMTVYTLMCYCTDNISIYIIYLFPLYLITYKLAFEREENNEQQ